MPMIRTLLLLAAAVLLLPVAGAGAAAGPIDAIEVGTDPQGDWGGGGDNALIGHAAGQDLVGASVEMPDEKNVTFTMRVTFLPSAGGVPEVSRYTWNFLVDTTPGKDNEDGSSDAKFFELDGKFTNYSRGVCDPTSGKCPPPRDPGQQPFFLRGNCTTNAANVTTCEEIATYRAVFTPATKSISVTVPADILGGMGPCTTITGGPNLFGGSISAAPSAYFTSSAMPLDTMEVTGVLEVPSEDPENNPCPPLFEAVA